MVRDGGSCPISAPAPSLASRLGSSGLPLEASPRQWFVDRGWPLPWFTRPDAESPPIEELLEGRSAEDIVRRLSEGDPLDLGPLSAYVPSEEATLVHPDRLAARAIAFVAYRGAAGATPDPSLYRWLRALSVQCMNDLAEEDLHAERRREPLGYTELEEFTELIPEATGIEPELTRLATVLFNRFSRQDRTPFYRCAIEGISLEDTAVQLNTSLRDVRRRIERVTESLVMQVETVRKRRDEGSR